MVNSARAAEPAVVMEQGGSGGGFVWPTVSVGSGPPGAGIWGGVVDAAFWPQLLFPQDEITITDTARAAGDTVSISMLYSVINEEELL